jgi:hypothetical protein
MKKVLLAIAVVAILGLGSSCSKQKTCHCTYTVEVLGVSTTTDLGDYTIEEGSCSDLEQNGNWNAQIGGLANAAIHCTKK